MWGKWGPWVTIITSTHIVIIINLVLQVFESSGVFPHLAVNPGEGGRAWCCNISET